MLVELAFRASVMFLFSIFAFRIARARALSQLSLAEVILLIALGPAVGDVILQPETPLIYGMVIVLVIVVLQRLLTAMMVRLPKVRRLLDMPAIRLVNDGHLDMKALQEAGISPEELFAELRQHEIVNMTEVRRAYIEPDGNFSVFRADPPCAEGEDYDLIEDGDLSKSA